MLPLLLAFTLAAAPADTPTVRVAVAPGRVFVERGASQYLNFDFVVQNRGADSLELVRVEASVYDRAGGLQLRKLVNQNGPSPSALTLLPDRLLAPGATGMVFNPFAEFPREVELATLRYELEFRARSGEGRAAPLIVHATVAPEPYANRTALQMPLDGRVLVWDGHELLLAPPAVELDAPHAGLPLLHQQRQPLRVRLRGAGRGGQHARR